MSRLLSPVDVRLGTEPIRVLDSGERDRPAVLLLHGLPDRASSWRHQIAALRAAGYRTIAPDLVGLGDSARDVPIERQTMAADLERALALLDHLEVARVEAVVCHDRGAGAGWLMAVLHPERLGRLVALSVGHLDAYASAGVSQHEKSWYMLYFQFAVEDRLRADDWAAFRAWLRHHPDEAQVLADMERPGALTACLDFYRANFNPDRAQTGGPVGPARVPTLGIWGSEDAFLGVEQMARSAEHMAALWAFERVDGAGHWLQLERPDRVNRLILDFLAETLPEERAAA